MGYLFLSDRMVKGRYFSWQRDKKKIAFVFNSIFGLLNQWTPSVLQCKIFSFMRKENAVSSEYYSLPTLYSTSLPLPNKTDVFSFIFSFSGNWLLLRI